MRPRQNGRHFPDNISKWIFLNENVWISINISLSFVPKGPNNNIPTLVQVMAWRRPGDKPLSEPMMVRLPTHTCVTRPHWVNLSNNYSNNWLYITIFQSIVCLVYANDMLKYQSDILSIYGETRGFYLHDDVIKWTQFPRYCPFVREIHRSPVVPLREASDAELWRFHWSALEQMVAQTIETTVLWNAIALIMTSL